MKYHFFSFIIASSVFLLSCTEKIIYEDRNPNSTTGSIVGVVLQNESNAKIIVRQEIPIDSTFINPADGSFRIEILPVGNYDLYVKAENYGTYRIHNVLVNAGGITYVGELSLSEVPDLVSSFYPQDKSEIVFDRRWSRLSISFHFTEPMDRESVEEAFSTDPPCEGVYYWGEYMEDVTPRYFWDERNYLAISDYSYVLNPGQGATITTYSQVEAFTFRMARKDCYTDTTYTVTLSTAAKDTGGNHLEFPVEFRFSTVQSALSLNTIMTKPEHGDIFVDPLENASIYMSFPKRMDQSSVENAMTISPSMDAIFLWSEPNKLRIYTGGPLKTETLYEIHLAETALDLDGLALGDPFDFSFETAPIEIINTYPKNGEIFVSRNEAITIYFNTYMVLSSIKNAFTIEPNIGGTFKRGTKYSNDDEPKNAITFIPSSNYLANTKYTVTINTTANDLHLTNLKEEYTFSFVTELE
jgi:hypothetical protein